MDQDRETYLQKIEECVQYSQEHVYDLPRFPNCSIVFTEEKIEHEEVRRSILADVDTSFCDSPLREANDPEIISTKNADNDCGNIASRMNYSDSSEIGGSVIE